MNPAELPPKPPPPGATWYSQSGPVSPAHPRRSEIAPCQGRDGMLPSAVPAPPSSKMRTPRQEILAGLRTRIRRIERESARSPYALHSRGLAWQRTSTGPDGLAGSGLDAARASDPWSDGDDEAAAGWCLGVPEIDQWIEGLDAAGLHEIKPAVPGPGMPAAMGLAAAFVFALRLAKRRLSGEGRGRAGSDTILLCMPARNKLELGRLYGPGLAALGLEARQFLIVETAKAADTLWAMEEGLRSQVPGIVIGCLDELPLTPARRLSLAADQHLMPCIAVTGARTPAAGATATRWRIGAARSAVNHLDPGSPGRSSCVAVLERCRYRAGAGERDALMLEWCDETFRFRMAPEEADREAAAGKAGAGA